MAVCHAHGHEGEYANSVLAVTQTPGVTTADGNMNQLTHSTPSCVSESQLAFPQEQSGPDKEGRVTGGESHYEKQCH